MSETTDEYAVWTEEERVNERAGYKAWFDGVSHNAAPGIYGTSSYNMWQFGWRAAEMAFRRACNVPG